MRAEVQFIRCLAPLLALGIVSRAQTATEQSRVLEAIRTYVQGYSRSLPNYTCLEVIHRTVTGGPGPTRNDVFEEEVSYVGGNELYKVTKVNGFRATVTSQDKLGEMIGGMVSTGEFGSLLDVLFDPATGTTFRSAPSTKIQGRTMNVITFRVPQSHGYRIVNAKFGPPFLVAYEGSLWADAKTNAVMRFKMRCVDLPSRTGLTSIDLAVDYAPTTLGNQQFALPVHFQLVSRQRVGTRVNNIEEDANTGDFTNYRRFTAESTLRLEDEAESDSSKR